LKRGLDGPAYQSSQPEVFSNTAVNGFSENRLRISISHYVTEQQVGGFFASAPTRWRIQVSIGYHSVTRDRTVFDDPMRPYWK
jgi:hypothetical protein